MRQEGDYGDIIISDEVIKRIITEIALSVEGTSSLSKNVKIQKKDDLISIDLFVEIKYGTRIPNFSWDLQQKIKTGIEQVLDLGVSKVNINIQGVKFLKSS